jgi:predicted PhzF superfamily epimerase YddE/YHI9
MRSRNAVPSVYVVSQGSQVGHRGEVFVTDDGTDIWIGGRTRMVIKGKVDL